MPKKEGNRHVETLLLCFSSPSNFRLLGQDIFTQDWCLSWLSTKAPCVALLNLPRLKELNDIALYLLDTLDVNVSPN